jgi:hypothetical protein
VPFYAGVVACRSKKGSDLFTAGTDFQILSDRFIGPTVPVRKKVNE